MKNLIQILEIGESETIEYKTSFNDEVIISLGAFANSKGGTVYIGVGDNGEMKGVNINKETISHWVNEVKNKTAPILIPDVEIFEEDLKTIVALKTQEYPVKPVSVRGKYYKRIKNSNHQLLVS